MKFMINQIPLLPRMLLMITAISMICFVSGCTIGKKSWAIANSADAFKISISDPQSGNIVPEIIAGGGANTMIFQLPYEAEKSYPGMFAYSRRKSLWGIFAGDTWSGNASIVYISGSKESPSDTIKILEKIAKIINPSEASKANQQITNNK